MYTPSLCCSSGFQLLRVTGDALLLPKHLKDRGLLREEDHLSSNARLWIQYRESLAKKRVDAAQSAVVLKRRAKSLPNLNIGSKDFQQTSSTTLTGEKKASPSTGSHRTGIEAYHKQSEAHSDKKFIRAFIGDIGHAFICSKSGKNT